MAPRHLRGVGNYACIRIRQRLASVRCPLRSNPRSDHGSLLSYSAGPGRRGDRSRTRYTPRARSTSQDAREACSRGASSEGSHHAVWRRRLTAPPSGVASFGREWRALVAACDVRESPAVLHPSDDGDARLHASGSGSGASFCDPSPCAWRAAVPCIYAPRRGWSRLASGGGRAGSAGKEPIFFACAATQRRSIHTSPRALQRARVSGPRPWSPPT